MDCKCLPGCPFFNDKMANMPAMANIMKKKYCQGNFESCARYMIFSVKGKPAVPSDLFPNEVEKAKKILGKK
ncbi:MAG: hypothetical protein JXR95_00705 [Deltaproteobacteria bacterium]|nr:hypothetical protein [Deltaproteobacteria bacterium]